MSIAIETNVLVRLLVRGTTKHTVRGRTAPGGAGRCRRGASADRARHPTADFADCLLTARAAHLGRGRFVTFDANAARLPGVELLA